MLRIPPAVHRFRPIRPRPVPMIAGVLASAALLAVIALSTAGKDTARPRSQASEPPPATPAAVLLLPHVERNPLPTPKPLPLRADIVLLVHTSATLTGARLDAVRAALSAFVAHLSPDRDQAALVTFGDDARVTVPLTRDPARLLGGIRSLSAGRGGRYDRGMRAARTVLLDLPDGRARNWENRGVVVVLSDAAHEGTANDAIAEAFFTGNAGFTILAVPLGPSADRDLLRRMSDAQFDAPDDAALAGAFEAVAGHLRSMD